MSHWIERAHCKAANHGHTRDSRKNNWSSKIVFHLFKMYHNSAHTYYLQLTNVLNPKKK